MSTKRWIVWTLKPWTGDLADPIAEYANRGHALAALKGLRRRAWLAASEVCYALRQA